MQSDQEKLKAVEIQVYSNNHLAAYLTMRSKIYKAGEVAGVMACGMELSNDVLGKITSVFDNPNHIEPHSYLLAEEDQLKKLGLTTRESECLFYLVRGMTAKRIAERLNVSSRTIETYVSNLKLKFNCNTISDLIETVFNLGIYYLIPNTLFNINNK